MLASPVKTPLLVNDTIAPGTSDTKIDIITTVSLEENASPTIAQPIPVLTVIKEAMTGNTDIEADEVIADDLSEISDDADEILNRQEVSIIPTFNFIYLTICQSTIPSTKTLNLVFHPHHLYALKTQHSNTQ